MNVFFDSPDNMRGHNISVLRGEYDLPGLNFEPRVIVDLGACCGAFAVWARRRFPSVETIHCYEPNPEAYTYLEKNVIANTYPYGIRAEPGRYALHDGANNLGEASFHDLGEQRTDGALFVECLSTEYVPASDLLKVDTEGCEIEIIRGLVIARDPVDRPKVVMYEYHRQEDMCALAGALQCLDYKLYTARATRPDRGVMCWAHKSIL